MNKQTFMIIVLALLLLQPVVAGISAPHAMGLAESSKTIAQDPGFRLDPSELTEHVPFEINGTADFVSQGWPGAGTPGNPYVISGLNITEDLGVYLISIMNTDASFVIRDCLLNQESAEDAIYLFNTSAARIEYSTITGGIHALEFLNSNNTVVDHSILISSSSYVVYLTYSHDASFTWNEFENDFRGIYGLYANGLSLSYNTYFCSDFYYVNYLFYCNDTTVSYETVVEGYSFRITDSYRISISDYIGAGINVINSESVDIQRVHLYYALSSTNSIVLISNAPGLNIQDSYISGPDTIGVSISSSSNFTFENNVIEDTSSYGISIVSSNNVSFVGNSIDDVGQYGVRFVGSDFLTIDDNELSNTGDIGIYIEDSMNGTVTNNILNHIGDMGVVLYTSHNWSVSDNFLDYIDSGAVYLEEADNITATRNYINYCDAGIVVDGSNRADVIDNHVTRALDTAYVVTSADNTVLAGNTADRVGIGASVDTGLAVVVEGNDFSRVSDTGLSLYDLESSFIRSNTISGTGTIGMDLDLILTSAIEDNDLTGFGFYFEPTRSYLYYNNTVTGNTVNGVPIYYELDVVGADLDADDYAQFFLINCSDVDIHDGTFDHVTIPIELILSPNNDIWNIVASDNRYGVYIDRSENTTILNADIDAGGVGEGVHVRLSDNFLLNESSIVGCRNSNADGLFLDRSDYATIENSEFDRNYYGIRADEVVDLLISGNTITNTQSYAISLWDPNTYFVRVLNNEIYNASYGIYHEQGDNVTISGNTIMYAYIWGIWASSSSSSDVNATLNIVTNNENGITFRNNGNSYIMNNTVMWNTNYGVFVDAFSAVDVYYNLIALNLGDNGYDDAAGNYWDDGSTLGNTWDDYTPPGVYAVDGNTQDRYPMLFAPTEPIISQPQDVYYAEESEGNEITWYAYDNYLRNWEVTIDGVDWDSDAWNFANIVVNIDGLSYGTHTLVITLWDNDQNSVTDTVLIHVYDGTPPSISNVPNTWSFVTGSGQTLTWQVYDLHPDSYVVYVDDDEFDSDTWTSGALEVNIDGLSEGVHVLIMEIYDIDGNVAKDSVEILVIDDTVGPSIDSPDDITYTFGEIGNSIKWNPTDQYPAYFEVSYNGSTMVEGSWGGSRIAVSVDGLSVGSHVFTITVEDGGGNTATDSVTVTVLPIQGYTTPPPPLDLGLVGLVVAGVAAVIIVVVVIFFIRKKRT